MGSKYIILFVVEEDYSELGHYLGSTLEESENKASTYPGVLFLENVFPPVMEYWGEDSDVWSLVYLDPEEINYKENK